jgi:hypothetical protein
MDGGPKRSEREVQPLGGLRLGGLAEADLDLDGFAGGELDPPALASAMPLYLPEPCQGGDHPGGEQPAAGQCRDNPKQMCGPGLLPSAVERVRR